MDRAGLLPDPLLVLPEISTPQGYAPHPTGLAELRISQGLSRERLAARAGISARTVYNLERGRCSPQAITQAVLARALDCRIEDIFPTNESDPAGKRGLTKKAEETSHGQEYSH